MEITSNNSIFQDDKLISLLKSNFNENDIELFELNYKIYTINKNNPNKFIVDLDTIWKWVGFSTKGNAKTLLIKESIGFKVNKDYQILLLQLQKQSLVEKRGGTNKEQILLTVNCFKKFCLKASTEQSEKIFDYYIKMEDIITKYIENKHNKILTETNNKLQLKDQETTRILELKNQEIETNRMMLEDTLNRLQLKDQEVEIFKNRKYDEIEKKENVYIFSSDKQDMYKIGKSKDIIQRRKSLQTGNVDEIIILHSRPTSNDFILEKIVHYVLDSYRYKSDGEFFTAKLEYMKFIIDIAGVFLDTLKSSYEYITKEELLQKINENILNQVTNIPSPIIESNIELNNKPIKKLNKKIINKLETVILPITDNIIESIVAEQATIVTLSEVEIELQPVFNFDNDIIDWFKLNYELTNNKEDTIKVKDIYEMFTKSTHYKSMKKIERKKYNKSYLLEYIKNNDFFIPYYCSISRLLRTFIKCWKIKNII
jgi:hypothetical protein